LATIEQHDAEPEQIIDGALTEAILHVITPPDIAEKRVLVANDAAVEERLAVAVCVQSDSLGACGRVFESNVHCLKIIGVDPDRIGIEGVQGDCFQRGVIIGNARAVDVFAHKRDIGLFIGNNDFLDVFPFFNEDQFPNGIIIWDGVDRVLDFTVIARIVGCYHDVYFSGELRLDGLGCGNGACEYEGKK